MEKRLKLFVQSSLFAKPDGKVAFESCTHGFICDYNSNYELPMNGTILVECQVSDDTYEVEYKLLSATIRPDSGMNVVYTFKYST